MKKKQSKLYLSIITENANFPSYSWKIYGTGWGDQDWPLIASGCVETGGSKEDVLKDARNILRRIKNSRIIYKDHS